MVCNYTSIVMCSPKVRQRVLVILSSAQETEILRLAQDDLRGAQDGSLGLFAR
jgi:hypothetical protein